MAEYKLGYADNLAVIADTTLPSTYMVPNDKHVEYKRWMIGRAYYFRVMKKWAKRYGGEECALVWALDDAVIASPEVAAGILAGGVSQ